MEDLMLQANESEIVNFLQNSDDDYDFPMPFERDIFLYGTEIAGTRHIDGMPELFEAINEGDFLAFVREPENPYDEYAIRIETINEHLVDSFPTAGIIPDTGNKLGYMPRSHNKIFARLMDAGKLIYGIVRHKEEQGGCYRIVVKIYMKE